MANNAHKRLCPRCKQPLHHSNKNKYRCNNENCRLQYVTYDKDGYISDTCYSTEPKAKQPSQLERMRRGLSL